MTISKVHLVPLSVFLLLPLSFITTYLVSFYLNDVASEFPFINDLNTKSPESCILSQLLNIVSFLLLFIIYLRYKQIEQYCRDHLSSESGKILCRNKLCLYIGCLSCFGLSIVANFQESTLYVVHLVGEFICFGFGIVYAWIHTWISFKTYPLVNSRTVAIVRAILCMVLTISFTVHAVTGPLALKHYHGSDTKHWIVDDGGYWLHVSSSIALWVLVFIFDVFIATFIKEMRKISITSPRVMFIQSNVNISSNYPYLTDDQVEIYPGSTCSSESLYGSLRNTFSSPGSNFRSFNQ